MSHTERLQRSPEAFRRLTGLTVPAFQTLLAQVEPAWFAAQRRRRERPGRQRRPGAGPKHALSIADQLLMLLIYYRTYVSHAFLAFLFAIDDATVCRNLRFLEPLLAGIFRIPERKVELQPDEIREKFPGIPLAFVEWERGRPIRPPQAEPTSLAGWFLIGLLALMLVEGVFANRLR